MNLHHVTHTLGQVASFQIALPYLENPLQSFTKLCHLRQSCLLLESAEIDSKDNLKSLMLIDAALRIECHGLDVCIEAQSDNGATLLPYLVSRLQNVVLRHELCDRTLTVSFAKANPLLDEESKLQEPNSLTVLRVLQKELISNSGIDFSIFLGGVIGYDLVAMVETLPEVPAKDNQCPDYVFYLAETLLVIDHQHKHTQLIGNVFCGSQAQQHYFAIGHRLTELQELLLSPLLEAMAQGEKQHKSAPSVHVDLSDAEFVAQVEALKNNIIAGDVFQVVPSRCFSLPCHEPFKAYAALKQQNPSPYMFYLQDKNFSLFGASPESALKYSAQNRQVEIYPIAGTRRRGFNAQGELDQDLDSRIELELRQDEKEKAEHLMLVDLARNDVARISIPGSRYVKELLKVDRYSYVMHLVSRVVGTLKPELDALHAYQACMNMGTLVGAPKVKAAELIRQVEKKRRGSYGGAVGYLSGNGDFDSCIVIRSAYVQDGTAYIQAGAGVVYDSVAQAEADETRSKAQAVISAIQSAGAKA